MNTTETKGTPWSRGARPSVPAAVAVPLVVLAALTAALVAAYSLDVESVRRLAAACVVGGGVVLALAAGFLVAGQRKCAALTTLFVVAIGIAGVTAVTRIQTDRDFVNPDESFQRTVAEPVFEELAEKAVDLSTTTELDFPQFLGPEGTAVVNNVSLAEDWERFPPEPVWRHAVGSGWSGFSVVNGTAITMEQRRELEVVTAYDVISGDLKWMQGVEARYENDEWLQSGVGPRSTPTINDGLVYSLGATGWLLCLDGADGQVIWRRNLLDHYGISAGEEQRTVPFGRAASPLLVGDLVIVPAGGPEAGRRVSLAAYHKKTAISEFPKGRKYLISLSFRGKASVRPAQVGGFDVNIVIHGSTCSPRTRRSCRIQMGPVEADGAVDAQNAPTAPWKTLPRFPRASTGPFPSNHSRKTPKGPKMALGNPDRPKKTGELVWEGGDEQVSYSSPVYATLLGVPQTYGIGSGLYELASKGDGTFSSEQVWQSFSVLRTRFTNVVVKDGYVYGLSDGILESIELGTGARMWKKGRYGHGQILLVGEMILVLTEDGDLVMVRATPDAANDVVGRVQVLDATTWNTFALYGSYVLVRNAQEAAVYKLAETSGL